MMEFDGVLPSLITLLLLPSTAESMVVTGAVVSGCTITLKVVGSAVLPYWSVALQVTSVVPIWNVSTRRWRTGNCGIRITCVSD